MPNDDDDLIGEAPRSGRRSAVAPSLRADSVRTEPVRKRRAGSKSEDHFYIPDSLLQQLRVRGLSCEFKRLTCFGKEEEPDYHISLQENGWEPLSLKDFPEFKGLMAKNWTKDTFEKRGQILMVRPQALTDEARAEERMVALGQVKGHLSSLGSAKAGEAPRTKSDGTPLVRVNRTYEAGIPIE